MMTQGEFTKPETNAYTIHVRLRDISKGEALELAEHIALLVGEQLPRDCVVMTVSHVKYEF